VLRSVVMNFDDEFIKAKCYISSVAESSGCDLSSVLNLTLRIFAPLASLREILFQTGLFTQRRKARKGNRKVRQYAIGSEGEDYSLTALRLRHLQPRHKHLCVVREADAVYAVG
jgi:hypothetical protein